MDDAAYTRLEGGRITFTSPTPAREVMSSVTYPVAMLAAIGDKIIKSTRKLATQKLISVRFAEIIIHGIEQTQKA